ncbi:inorganic phosphate transporter [Phycicoccus sp. BSK3Z-2]|uniref:Inorganic phosphate transporter n=1 Tax=Phycicoccus avicenniae TaxID=2828860 RepID=A0A941D685_9MICO|nr:inorganic phosphate transporter [Phycicoccus avicenniae]MBR7741888.1 inorganic phosphate transporter [Phycicoccus avicenniae]
MEWWPVVLVVVVALGFTYTNGFHDAANAVATSIATKALTPRIALGLAALMNLLGAFAGMRVAETIGNDIVAIPVGGVGVTICVAALLGATTWNLLTWWRGMPTSSTHALVSGLAGAALAGGATVQWEGLRDKVAVPTVLSPVVGLVGGLLLMTLVFWLFRRAAPGPTARRFRYAQTVSASAMAFGHGMQDATKSAGVVALALVATGHRDATETAVPLWALALSAVVLALGTYAGGWRIIRTLGRGISHLDPPQGFAAETTAATILYVATATGAPISTTHTITAAILGVGTARSPREVRWGTARRILLAWVLTVPGAGLAAAAVTLVVVPVL